ncbi:MAG: hypothetical protein HOH81_04390, partial [Flavobacteriaceae bacterium]|nr:hypothetical protein [Flavobacteriaceae bacterium]
NTPFKEFQSLLNEALKYINLDKIDSTFVKLYEAEKKLATLPNENLHLPGVPSAAERSKRGIDLGRATEINLEKIEELFLHTIEQQKQIETQNKLIQQLLQRVQALENKE